METCSYCETPIFGSIGVVRIEALKGTRTSFSSEVDISIGKSVFCDSGCLCNAIKEMEWTEQNAEKYNRDVVKK